MYNIFDNASHQQVRNVIKHIWHKLTDEEIDARDELRDVFFLAVRKKHGVLRAQAELILSELEHQVREAA